MGPFEKTLPCENRLNAAPPCPPPPLFCFRCPNRTFYLIGQDSLYVIPLPSALHSFCVSDTAGTLTLHSTSALFFLFSIHA